MKNIKLQTKLQEYKYLIGYSYEMENGTDKINRVCLTLENPLVDAQELLEIENRIEKEFLVKEVRIFTFQLLNILID